MCERRRTAWGVGLGVVACLIWSTTFLVGRFVLCKPEVNPFLAALVRYGGGAVILLTWLTIRGGARWGEVKRFWPSLAALGLTGVGLQGALVFWALHRASALIASVLFNIAPLFVALIGAVLKVEAPDAFCWAGVVLGFGGAALVTCSKAGGETATAYQGAVAAIVGSGLWALYTYFSRPVARELGAEVVATYTVVFGALFIGLCCAILRPKVSLSRLDWALLVYMALFPTAISYLLWQGALRWAPAALVAPTLYLTPVGTIALAKVMLGEQYTAPFFLGSALVFAGLYLASFRKLGE